MLLVLVYYFLLKVFKALLKKQNSLNNSNQFVLYTFVKYLGALFVVNFVLTILNVELSMLVASSAAIFVGIGLGLQHLFYDFFSGMLLLLDGSIKVGNVIEFNGKRVEVVKINFRTSIVKTREEKEIIVPNSILTKNEIVNWSNQQLRIRHDFTIPIHIADIDRAMKVILQSLQAEDKILNAPLPYVRIENFTDAGVDLKVLFWSNELLAVGRLLGDIRYKILQNLLSNQINIPTKTYSLNLHQTS